MPPIIFISLSLMQYLTR